MSPDHCQCNKGIREFEGLSWSKGTLTGQYFPNTVDMAGKAMLMHYLSPWFYRCWPSVIEWWIPVFLFPFFCVLCFGPNPAILRAYSWLYIQELPPVVNGGQHDMPGIKSELATCKASTLPAVLLLLLESQLFLLTSKPAEGLSDLFIG